MALQPAQARRAVGSALSTSSQSEEAHRKRVVAAWQRFSQPSGDVQSQWSAKGCKNVLRRTYVIIYDVPETGMHSDGSQSLHTPHTLRQYSVDNDKDFPMTLIQLSSFLMAILPSQATQRADWSTRLGAVRCWQVKQPSEQRCRFGMHQGLAQTLATNIVLLEVKQHQYQSTSLQYTLIPNTPIQRPDMTISKRQAFDIFKQHYGRDQTRLEGWQDLCEDCGIDPAPSSITQCKARLKRLHVNIHEFLRAKAEGGPIFLYPSRQAMLRYTRGRGKTFPLEWAKENEFIKIFLTQF